MHEQKTRFIRLAQTHKPDCAMSLEGVIPEAIPSPDELALTLGSDAVGRYASQCRPVYEDLRRIIGQISGLLILAQLTKLGEISDLPEYTACKKRLVQAEERFRALSAPSGTQGHKAQIEAALTFSRLAMGTFSVSVKGKEYAAKLDLSGLQIKRAYAHLSAASTEKAGLEMVDLANACCGCGH